MPPHPKYLGAWAALGNGTFHPMATTFRKIPKIAKIPKILGGIRKPAKGKAVAPTSGATTDKSNSVVLNGDPKATREMMLAEFALSGVANSALVGVAFSKENYGELSLNDCIAVLVDKSKDIREGNLECAETMLLSQAVALDAVFASLARRAQLNMGRVH
jgi:hypothetical protein